MKKYLLTAFITLTTVATFGQIKFGAKAGLNLSNVNFEQITGSPGYRLGVHAGVLAEVNATQKLFIRPELLYSLKGCTFPATFIYQKSKLEFHYVTLPILVGYRITPAVSVYVGPEVAYLASAYSNYPGGKYNLKKMGIYQDTDFGLTAGFTYKLTGSLSADARFSYGLKKINQYETFNNEGVSTGKKKDGNNLAFQFGAMYTFDK